MRKIKFELPFIILLLFHAPGFTTENARITHIKDEYQKVAAMFTNSDRESSPNISTCEIRHSAMPVTYLSYSRASFYWELYALNDKEPADSGNEGMRLRKTECYHQKGFRTAKDTSIYYEEFLFDEKGSVLFYYLKEGIGNIFNKTIGTWNREERYYFNGDKVIRIMIGKIINDSPGTAADNKARAIVRQGKIMKEFAAGMNFRPLEPVDK